LLNYRQVALFSMGRNLVKLVLLSLFWFGIPNYEWNHSHIVIIYLLSPLLVITLLELLIPSGISFRTMTFDRLLFNKMSAYGMPIAGSAVALAILMQGDVVLLEYFHGEATTGNYYAARQLFLPVMLLPIAFRGLLVPAIAGNRLSLDNWRKPATIVLGTAAFVAVIAGLTGPLLVEVVYGPDFEAEQSLTLTICASAWILSAKGIIEAVILGHGRSLRMLLANATAAATALVTYLWIIPANGTSGAAQALLLSSTVALLSTTVAFVTLETEDRAPALVGSGNGDD